MAEDLPFASSSDVVERGGGLNSARGNAFRDDRRNESAVVQAHRFGQGAEEASRKGNHAKATEMHLAAARDFFRAAEQVQEHAVLASSLLLLADSHAARAEKGAIRLRLSGDGRSSLNKVSSPLSPPSSHSARDLTPAEAYRAAASGVNASGTRGKGGGGKGDRHSAHSAVGPDMDDSIMRGTGANSVSTPGGAGDGDAVAELAKKFRPQRDDLLELERQLAKLGLESKTGGARVRARHRLAEGNPPHLSSALGDSFFFLNKSVIFGGTGAAAGGLAGGLSGANAYDNGVAAVPPPPTARMTPGHDGGGGGSGNDRPASSPRISGRGSATAGATMAGAGLDSGSRTANGTSTAAAARGARGTGGEAPLEPLGSNRGRRSVAGGAAQAAAGDVESGRGGRDGELGEESEPPLRPALSAAAETRRAKEEETQQGEIMRLLTCLKTLGDENASLMKECEDRDKVRQESESIREEMKRFQLKYQERFTLLKKTLDEVMRSYPQLTAPGSGAASVGGGASGADSARLTEEVQRLAQSNRKLTEQVRKYENYYKELCQKAESKRKEQLSQAKAARQQQLAHHPSFGQQQQQQPQQQQPQPQPQQQQQQRAQRRLSPAPGGSRRALQQQQQQQQGLPPQTRRSSSAPSSQQHPATAPAGAGAAASGNPPQQHYPAFSQQHFRQNQHQHQPQPPQNISGSQGVPGYRGTGSSQPPAAVRAMAARGGRPTVAGGAAPQPIRGVAVNRSAGLVEESEV